MKKAVAFVCSLFFGCLVFAQSFSAQKDVFVSVYKLAESNDVISGAYEITNVNPMADSVVFNYSWTQITGKGIMASAMQYKMRFSAVSSVSGDKKTFALIADDKILSRAVNKDGSKKSGVPTMAGVTYDWAESKTLVGKAKLIKAVSDDVSSKMLAVLSVSDDEYKIIVKDVLKNNINKIAKAFEPNALSKFLEAKGLSQDEEFITSTAVICAVGANSGNELQFKRFLEKNTIIGRTVTLACTVSSVNENQYRLGNGAKYMLIAETDSAMVSLFTNNGDVIDFNPGDRTNIEGKISRVSYDSIGILNISLEN